MNVSTSTPVGGTSTGAGSGGGGGGGVASPSTVPSMANNGVFVSDPPSLQNTRETYRDLHHLLGNLSQKLTNVSHEVDKEFLSAYRVHMLSIQAEIKRLKQDVAKGEQILNSDATVAKLENETKWFSGKLDFVPVLCAPWFV
jgi:hypothetical protein